MEARNTRGGVATRPQPTTNQSRTRGTVVSRRDENRVLGVNCLKYRSDSSADWTPSSPQSTSRSRPFFPAE